MRRMFVPVLVGLLVLLPATIATAGPPDESGVVDRVTSPGIAVLADPEDNLLVLVNVTSVEGFCSEEPASAGVVQVAELPGGVTVVSVSDDDVPVVVVPEDGFGSACDDPASFPIIATGTANFRLSDNDAFGSGTRGNVFGRQLQGTVTDDDGSLYNLTAFFRVRITPDGDGTLLRSDVTLIPR